MVVKEGTLLWEPTEKSKKESVMSQYIDWLNTTYNKNINGYEELWEWSVNSMEDFWESVWNYYEVKSYTPYENVLKGNNMPDVEWFPGATLNFAEHILKNVQKDKTVIYSQSENRELTEMTWEDLAKKTAAVSSYLRNLGVESGDRVVGYMPNISETVIAFLATASIGAIWSSCAPEFGVESTLGRFKQIEPKVLFTIDGYKYNGKDFDRMQEVSEIVSNLPTLEKVVLVPYLNENIVSDINELEKAVLWDDVLTTPGELEYEQVPFSHPLWILYSSGTTGLPKAIVQGHGGILLTQLVNHGLQGGSTSEDIFFWQTTTGWMLWNTVVGAMLTGASIVLYDGSPAYPNLGVLWDLAEKTELTAFGTSPTYILTSLNEGIVPKNDFDLSKINTFSYTGAPLSPEGFQWIYDNVSSDVRVAPTSGGTDICAGIVAASPLLPVHAGEIPGKCLGVAVYSYDKDGQSVINEVGEMVITKPFPSMPLFFWNDENNEKYLESYFDVFPGVWNHGDLLKITTRGSAVIYGRSDATINRMGVRSGSSEIYNAIESLPEIMDSLVVDLSGYKQSSYMPLFIVLNKKFELTDELKEKINKNIKEQVSPRHIPNDIFAVTDIPRTLTGKKMEVPIKKVLLGVDLDEAISIDAMSNPESLDYYIDLAQTEKIKNVRQEL